MITRDDLLANSIRGCKKALITLISALEYVHSCIDPTPNLNNYGTSVK